MEFIKILLKSNISATIVSVNIKVMEKRPLIIIVLFFSLFFSVYGDAGTSGAAAVIIYTEGDNFDVLDSSGNSISIDPYSAIGSELAAGDIILTYDNTYVEIQLADSEHIIKIAENTDFRLDKVETKRESSFRMFYGSIRAKVAKLGKGERFRVSGNEAMAGVRGTDFGMTVVVTKEGENLVPFTRVYCFKGVVEVEPVVKEKTGETTPVAKALKGTTINANEMVTISKANYITVLRPEAIPENIVEYWEEHKFRGTPIPLKPAQAKSAQVKKSASSSIKPKKEKPGSAKEKTQILKKDFSREMARLKAGRTAYLSTGFVLLSAGILLETAGVLGTVFPEEVAAMFPAADRKLVINFLAVGGSVSIAVSFFSLLKANEIKTKIKRLKSGR